MEIIESAKILVELHDEIKNSNNERGKNHKQGGGEGLSQRRESSGDLAYYVKLNNGIIDSVSLLTPSQVNLNLFLKSVINTIFTDFQFNWESFGIWVSEIGVMLK